MSNKIITIILKIMIILLQKNLHHIKIFLIQHVTILFTSSHLKLFFVNILITFHNFFSFVNIFLVSLFFVIHK